MRETEKWTNKGNDKQEVADLSYPNVCFKFQNPRFCSWEIFDENFHIHYM